MEAMSARPDSRGRRGPIGGNEIDAPEMRRGSEESTPTRWPLSVASPRKTMRDSCSSCVKGLVSTTMASMSSGWSRYIRPPCALMTMVSQASRKRRLSEFLPATTTRTRMKTRVLRRTLS